MTRRILIDIGHPAHVHYFRNFAKLMEKKGHKIKFTIRNKESAIQLAKYYNLDYVERGNGGKNILTKILLLPIINFKVYRVAKRFKPDIMLSFGSPYAAHVSKLINVPHIAFDDTEHARFTQKLYRPFTDLILSPSCYTDPIIKNQQFFNSYMELSYLHPNHFEDDDSIFNDLGLKRFEKYSIIRFIAWNANHDVGQKGLNTSNKIKIVKEIEKKGRVFISSESELPNELASYKLQISPERLHQALRFASLYIGEGSTTATEAALLGTTSIYVNTLNVGYCTELENKYKTLFQTTKIDDIINKANKILSDPNSKEYSNQIRDLILKDKIDTTQYMVKVISDYLSKMKFNNY